MLVIKDFTKLKIIDKDIKIQLYCWLESYRCHKNILFLILRNNSIILQANVKNNNILSEKILTNITKESYIEVIGLLINRETKFININQFLGDKEIIIEDINLISKSKVLPFEINESHVINDSLRCEYKYLDHRNKIVSDKIKIKDYIVRDVRNYFYENDFNEIQTPLITCSTPEGALDYLVFSSQHKNKVYALPQSPQLYKQLLMAGGYNKYFQIAPCFRDEKSRKNRLSTEFYQIDLELNHLIEKEEIIHLIDNLIFRLINKFKNKKAIKIKNFSYNQVINIYGSDKIDLRVIEKFNFEIKENKIFFNNIENIYNKIVESNININIEDNVISLFINNQKLSELQSLLSQNCNDINYTSYCWIYDYPFYILNNENKLVFSHNPFSKIKDYCEENSIAEQYDLIINGEEIGGGSLRENNINNLIRNFEFLDYKKDIIKSEFCGFIDAFDYGFPNHGGIALGLERLCCFLIEEDKLREFVAFPTLQNGVDLLLNSPRFIKDEDILKYNFKNINNTNNINDIK